MKRPTEIAVGLPLAALVYDFLHSHGLPEVYSAIIAGVCGFGPLVFSAFVDAWRQR